MKVLGFLALFAVAVVAKSAAVGQKVTPVTRVISLLKDLSVKVQAEGKAEAAQYDKFACFVKEEAVKKQTAIEENTALSESLEASIEEHQAQITVLGGQIDDISEDVTNKQSTLAQDKEARTREHEAYVSANKDIEKAISAVDRAIEALKESRPGSLAQVTAVSKNLQTIRNSLMMMSVLDLSSTQKRVVKDFLKQEPHAYEFHSNEIIATLQELLKTFIANKNQHDREEANNKSEFELMELGVQNAIKNLNAARDRLTTEMNKHESESAAEQEQKNNVDATLKDDQAYLAVVTQNAEEKATLWDQRSKARAEELAAITEAIKILEGSVTPLAESTGAGGRFKPAPAAAELVSTEETEPQEDVEQEEEDIDGDMLSFLQMPQGPRERMIAFLRKKASLLKSASLTSLAVKIADDPFAKVKLMISGLIAKLEQQMQDEQTHKEWCDKEMAAATAERTKQQSTIETTKAGIMENEAKRDSLVQENLELSQEVADLQKSLDEQSVLRAEEKRNNEKTIADSEAGHTAVQQAITVLQDYYGTALLQADPAGPAVNPKEYKLAVSAGFDAEYNGATGSGKGIIAILQTIAGDFMRTKTETEADEAKAAADFETFKSETETSIGQKNDAIAFNEGEIETTESTLEGLNEDLSDAQTALDLANKEIEKLRPACENAGESWEERSRRRNEEIAALREALRILQDTDFDFMQVEQTTKRLRRH